MNDDDVNQMVDSIDIDNNDKIYWNEFLSCVLSPSIVFKDENIKEIFKLFD